MVAAKISSSSDCSGLEDLFNASSQNLIFVGFINFPILKSSALIISEVS